MQCANCPVQIEPDANGEWVHRGEAPSGGYDKVCRHGYNPDILPVATPDDMSTELGFAVVVSTRGMAYYGVLKNVSPVAVVIVTRDGTVTPVLRERVTGIRRINDPTKVGLRHDHDRGTERERLNNLLGGQPND